MRGGCPMSTLYAESLRVIGQWLDSQAADETELRCTADETTVHWRRTSGEEDSRTFAWTELHTLGERARRQRKHPFGEGDVRWAGALRTLGQELDDAAVEPLLLRSLAGGVQVYGTQGGNPY